jgi:hypothetical protein
MNATFERITRKATHSKLRNDSIVSLCPAGVVYDSNKSRRLRSFAFPEVSIREMEISLNKLRYRSEFSPFDMKFSTLQSNCRRPCYTATVAEPILVSTNDSGSRDESDGP